MTHVQPPLMSCLTHALKNPLNGNYSRTTSGNPLKFAVVNLQSEEVGQALVWLICVCGKTQECNYFFQQGQARSR